MSKRYTHYEDDEYDDFDEDVMRGSKRPNPAKEVRYINRIKDRKTREEYYHDRFEGYDDDRR